MKIDFLLNEKSTYNMLSTLNILLDYYNKEIAVTIKNAIDVMEKNQFRFAANPHFQECI